MIVKLEFLLNRTRMDEKKQLEKQLHMKLSILFCKLLLNLYFIID